MADVGIHGRAEAVRKTDNICQILKVDLWVYRPSAPARRSVKYPSSVTGTGMVSVNPPAIPDRNKDIIGDHIADTVDGFRHLRGGDLMADLFGSVRVIHALCPRASASAGWFAPAF